MEATTQKEIATKKKGKDKPPAVPSAITGLPEAGWSAEQYAQLIDTVITAINAAERLAVDYYRLGMALNRIAAHDDTIHRVRLPGKPLRVRNIVSLHARKSDDLGMIDTLDQPRSS